MDASKQHSSKFKTAMKQLLPSYIITFVFCFMLFVYEPLLMYSTNKLDFWFDLRLMTPPMLAAFAAFFFGGAIILTAAFLINKAIVKEKEPTAYRLISIALFFVFFAAYLQGNLLAGSLPALDGSVIEWNSFGKNDIITFIVWLALGGAAVFMLVKLGVQSALKYVAGVSVVLFIMLTVSLVTEMISWDAFKRKDSVITTNVGFNTISEDKNFVIFLADAVGSTEFGNVLNDNPEYKEVFEDFTYFPDTLGCYPCTRDTIPLVLGGALNKNEKAFEQFSSEAYSNSPFFKELDERGYDISLYDAELIWYGDKNVNISNSADYKNYRLPIKTFFREEMKYVKFKYLPYAWKRYSKIETMDFNGLVDKYIWDNRTVYKMTTNVPNLKKQSGKTFKFVHTEGAHIPFQYDKNLNIVDGYTDYETKIEATITMINAYIERLKANGTYDNTVIIIMADHGNTNLNEANDMLVRGNPMFLVKGADEHHEFAVSEKPLSYLDLMDIYTKLLDDNSAEEAVADIPDKRERYFMWYRNFRLENHIEEYVVTDKAWEWQKFKKTGNEYDLK